jgi:periplasmic protein TonB
MISIVVNLKGIVEDAKVNTGESTTTNPCLIETALQAALLSRFNADVDAPRTQKGTITYHFVAQ